MPIIRFGARQTTRGRQSLLFLFGSPKFVFRYGGRRTTHSERRTGQRTDRRNQLRSRSREAWPAAPRGGCLRGVKKYRQFRQDFSCFFSLPVSIFILYSFSTVSSPWLHGSKQASK